MNEPISFGAEGERVFPALFTAVQMLVEVGERLMGRKEGSVHCHHSFLRRLGFPLGFSAGAETPRLGGLGGRGGCDWTLGFVIVTGKVVLSCETRYARKNHNYGCFCFHTSKPIARASLGFPWIQS